MTSRKPSKSRFRRGVEAVEAAVSLPLLALAVFATVEIAHRWHVEKMIKIATYEAIKVGAAVDGSSEDAIRVFDGHTKAMGIRGARLSINRSAFDRAEPGDRISLEGRAIAKLNKAPTPQIMPFESKTLTGGRIIYYKEGL